MESAAYGALLDVDALILFTYDAGAARRTIGYFDIHLDPLRWGVVSEASRLFLSGDVKAATHTVGIGYSTTDAYTWQNYVSPLYQLGFSSRVLNYTDTSQQHPFDLLVTSGRSSGEAWPDKRLLYFANGRQTDIHYQNYTDGLDALEGYKWQTLHNEPQTFVFRGIGYDAGVRKFLPVSSSYSLAELTANKMVPVATADTAALGFIDPKRKTLGFRALPEEVAMRIALDTLHDWHNTPTTHDDLDQGIWRSDTGQIVRNLGAGVITVDTPSIQLIAGSLDTSAALQTSELKMTTPTAIGTLVAESLDGEPLASSANFLVKMTSRARNDQTVITPAKDGPRRHKLSTAGEAPIRTDGKASAIPTHVELNGKLLLEVGMQDGTWEYLADADRALFYTDTGDITLKLPVRPKVVRWYTANEVIDMTPDDETFTVPEGLRFAEIIW